MHELVSRRLFEDGIRTLTVELAAARGWVLHSVEYPLIDVSFTATTKQSIRARFHWHDWDAQPPSVDWLASDGAPLAALPRSPRGQLNSSAHPGTGRPFVCMAGIREYHTHPGHVGDSWDNYRNRPGYDIGGLLTQVWRAWGESTP